MLGAVRHPAKVRSRSWMSTSVEINRIAKTARMSLDSLARFRCRNDQLVTVLTSVASNLRVPAWFVARSQPTRSAKMKGMTDSPPLLIDTSSLLRARLDRFDRLVADDAHVVTLIEALILFDSILLDGPSVERNSNDLQWLSEIDSGIEV